MAEFKLEIFTPEHNVFSQQVEAVRLTGLDGEFTVLAGHAAMVAALGIGSMSGKQGGKWHDAFTSEGFVEVRPDETLIFAQAFEWEEDIDVARAQAARARVEARLRSQQSKREFAHNSISMARALARLRVSKKSPNQ